MSWFMVGSAAVSVGTAVYSASKNKKVAPGQAPQIDPQAVQDQTIQGNLKNQADIEKLTASTNSFDQSQAISLMNQAMPGYSSLAGKLTSRASDLASNPYSVPADVQQNLSRLAAEKGVSTGRSGQAGQFSLLRDLGVNELQYGQSNLNQASGITSLLASIAPKVNPMSPMSMYLTPQQGLNAAVGNQSTQQAALNAQAGAQNANTQTQANMWGQIGGSVAGLLGSGELNGVFTSNSNPSGMDTSTNGAYLDMLAATKNGISQGNQNPK